MSIRVIGVNHQTCPVELRERFAFTNSEISAFFDDLTGSASISEAVVVSTCNRTEVYATSNTTVGGEHERISTALLRNRRIDSSSKDVIYCYKNQSCLEHLLAVACGLNSMVLGETEILGQIKQAYNVSLQNGYTSHRLNKIFQTVFRIVKKIRSTTGVQRGATSVPAVAVKLVEKIFDGLDDKRVMILGAGDMGKKTGRALLSRGAQSLIVSNRSYPKALELALQLGGHAIPFSEWKREFSKIDIVISSTSAQHYLIDVDCLGQLLPERRDQPLVLIDIAVPRDIDPRIAQFEDVYLYNVDDLKAIAESSMKQRREEAARCKEIIRTEAAVLYDSIFVN